MSFFKPSTDQIKVQIQELETERDQLNNECGKLSLSISDRTQLNRILLKIEKIEAEIQKLNKLVNAYAYR